MKKVNLSDVLAAQLVSCCKNSVQLHIKGVEENVFVRSTTYNKIRTLIEQDVTEGYIQLSEQLGTYWLLVPQI